MFIYKLGQGGPTDVIFISHRRSLHLYIEKHLRLHLPSPLHVHTVLKRIIVIQLRSPLGKVILHINQYLE